jgi:geranylgeranyl reductase family protein
MDYDVAVVGAGPAGSVAAREIAAAGLRVVMLEEHPQVGTPVHCSGLVTPRTLEAAGVDEGLVVNRIHGAIIHTPQGREIALRDGRVHALVIDRAQLDRTLAERAQEAGATLVTETRAEGVQREEGRMRVAILRNGRRSTLDVSLVIGADGSRSVVGRSLGGGAPSEAILAAGGEIVAQTLAPDMVEVFVRPDLAPGWFAWTIPIDGKVARIGIGSSDWRRNPRRLLHDLVGQYKHLRGATFLRLQGGVIPVTPSRRVVGQGVMLVGDAAGQVKPTSGGGIYTSIVCARLCAQVAVQAIQSGDPQNGTLGQYETLWMRHIGVDLLRGEALRRLLLQVSPDEIERFLGLFALKEVQAIAYQEGDIDFPARMFHHLFRPGPVLHGLRALPLRLWPRMANLLYQWYRARAARVLG